MLGHWTVNYDGAQSFIITLSYILAQKLWVINFDWIVPNLMCSSFKSINNFILHLSGCKSIYR